MYRVSVTYVSAVVAGVLAAAVLAAWPWARARRRFVLAGITTLVSWIAWHLLLNATGAYGFDVDAPVSDRRGLRTWHGAPRTRRPRGRGRGDRGAGRDGAGRLRLARFLVTDRP